MILDHVPQLSRLVKITPAPLYSHLFCHCNLDVVNGIVIPVGSEYGIGKAKGDQIQDRLLAQVVVDPVDLALVKETGHHVVDLPRRLKVFSNGLFQHHPSVVPYTVCMVKPHTDGLEEAWCH